MNTPFSGHTQVSYQIGCIPTTYPQKNPHNVHWSNFVLIESYSDDHLLVITGYFTGMKYIL